MNTEVIPIPAMPRAMQSTAIPKRGNPGLLCPRNSAIPLHSHSEHLAETRGAFSPQVLNTALERQSYKELEIPIARSQYLFLYTGADSTSFFPPFVSFLWPDPTLQSRAEQGRAGLRRDWPWAQQCLGPSGCHAAVLLLCASRVCRVLGTV